MMQQIYDPITGLIQYVAGSNANAKNDLKIVQTIANRDALSIDYRLVYVIDATADLSVTQGGATYGRDELHNWIKLSEAESMDLLPPEWNNINHRPVSTPAAIDDAVNKVGNGGGIGLEWSSF